MSIEGRLINVYVAYRDSDDVYLKEHGWEIDADTLTQLRYEGALWVAIWVRDTGDLYLAPRDYFYDTSKIAPVDYSRRGGENQKVLPLHHFFKRLEGFRLKGSSTSLRRAA